MEEIRGFDAEETLKEVLHRWAKGSRFTLARQADQLNIPKSTLSNACNPDVTDCHYQLRWLVPHTVMLGDYTLLDWLESCVGRVAFRIPEVPTKYSDFRRELSRSVREFGELLDAVGTALEDSHVSSEELVRIEQEGNDVVRQTMTFLESLRQSVRE